MTPAQQKLCVLGATGSIGDSTLDVAARNPERYVIDTLAANTNVEKMLALIKTHRPRLSVMTDELAANTLRLRLKEQGIAAEVASGNQALTQAAQEADVVMAAIVGAAGLAPTLAAAKAGKTILLANKEALVMAGSWFVQTCRDSQALVLPVDSEHNAIFQCLPSTNVSIDQRQALVPSDLTGIAHLVLTASGGPFRNFSLQEMAAVTPAQAVAHPNWVMGRKISVDSATLMNKGLELIEACWLFGLPADRIQVVVHPQSIIHSMAQTIDGSLLAQMGLPDMRTPIAHCMGWPQRISSGVGALDMLKVGRLDFQAPDKGLLACAWPVKPGK
jgi:1-deoxy-D-xylulose-5-phosphate reductoisomerase